jgi:hypothetical protein
MHIGLSGDRTKRKRLLVRPRNTVKCREVVGKKL